MRLYAWQCPEDNRAPSETAQSGCHPLREFPYDDAIITLNFGIKAIRKIFNAQKLAVQPNLDEQEQKCFRDLFRQQVDNPEKLQLVIGLYCYAVVACYDCFAELVSFVTRDKKQRRNQSP